MSLIDIHTHMFGNAWLEQLTKYGGIEYSSKTMHDNRDYLLERGAPACALEAEAFDYDLRIKSMDKDDIDIAIVSLTSPNVFWGRGDEGRTNCLSR